MSEEKNVLEQVIEAIKKLLGFGTDEQIAGVVNGIVDAQGDEAGVVGALQGLFGEAVPQADLLSVVQDVTAKGNGIDLNNMLDLFQGIGDKAGGFDKIAGLLGGGAAKEAADAIAGAATNAADGATDTVVGAVDAVSGAAAAVPSIDEAVSGIQQLMGFGEKEQVTTAVNQIVEANGDEGGILSALTGLFGDAIPKPDLLGVVTSFLGKGAGLNLGNILDLFKGIGEKIGGFDKIANLMGAAPSAGGVTDAIADVASSVTGAVKGAAGAATDAAGAVADGAADAAGAAVDTAKNAVGSVTGAVKEAAGAAGGAAAGAAHAATGAVKGAAHKVADTATGAVDGVKQVAAEPAKKRKKWPITLGVIAAIVALAGIGMWIWHEQPSFCSTMCHTSMDAYVEMYDQEDNVAGVDKYGNDVANTHAMLAVSHKAAKNMTCLSCHIPALDQQIGEVMETITGNYTVVERVNGNGFALPEVALAELQENAHLVNDSGKGDEFCLRSGCHDFTRDVLAKATESMEFNPHIAQHGEIACGECHKSHRASVFYCTQCHAEASNALPEGWLTYQEGQKANVA